MNSTVRARSNSNLSRFSVPTQAESSRGMPVNPMAVDKKAAPAKINDTITLVRVAPKTLSIKFCLVIEPVKSAMSRAPTTPTAAASVAVAMPR